MENRVRFKIGEIEFEAEGTSELIERERNIFLNSLLPAAVDAIVRTRGEEKEPQYFETVDQSILSLSNENSSGIYFENDLSQISFVEYTKQFGNVSDQNFVLISAYFQEKKNGEKSFSSANVKQFFSSARKRIPSNTSDLLQKLAKKGYIMDDPNSEKESPKKYILTNSGIQFVDNFQAKDQRTEKPIFSGTRKTREKAVSVYSEICADDLNLKNYPEIKKLDSFKKQMLLSLFIVTNEGKGDTFSTADIQFIMTDILGLPASKSQISGVFRRNRNWFKTDSDPNNQKMLRRKLLQGAKDFAQTIIDGTAV